MKNTNKKLDTKEMLDVLTEQTQKVVKEFLSYYSPISHNAYISAISNLFYILEIENVANITINDFRKIQEFFMNKKEDKSKNYTFTESFFRFLYAFDKLNNPDGFENLWIKKDWIKRFNKQFLRLQSKEKKVSDNYKPSLSLKEITDIQQILSLDYKDNIKMLRISFYWYLLFETDCTKNEIIQMVASDYNSDTNTIKSNIGMEYYVPNKYLPIFDYLRDRTYSGFNNVNYLIIELGNLIGIKKLIPQMIKSARKENMLKCSMCGNNYSNTNENWASINNRIICIDCAEEIKKKNNVVIDIIENEDVNNDILTENVKIEPIIYTFDELKKKLDNKIDYLNLHKFLMEVGNLGEAFVVDLEKIKLAGTKYEEYVSNIPALNPLNGYDIISYDLDGKEIYIEVKTETKEENDFYMSDYEFKMAQKFINEHKKYIIYRVSNILAKDKSKIKYEIIENITDNNYYEFNVHNWRISKKSYID